MSKKSGTIVTLVTRPGHILNGTKYHDPPLYNAYLLLLLLLLEFDHVTLSLWVKVRPPNMLIS